MMLRKLNAARGPALWLILSAALFLASGCAPRWDAQYARAQAINTPEAYEDFIRVARDPYLVRQAREQLATLRAAQLGDPPGAEELWAYLDKFRDTEVGAAWEAQLPGAILRDEVLTLRGDLKAMGAAFDRWANTYPEQARELGANDHFNDIIVGRIRSERLEGVELAEVVGAMRQPSRAKRRSLEGALIKLFDQQESTGAFVQAIRSTLPAWLSTEARDAIVRTHVERFEAALVTTATTADEIRPFLERMSEKTLESRRGSELRNRYDELMLEAMGPEGTPEQARLYLRDPFTRLARPQLENQIGALEAEVGDEALARLQALLSSDPPPYIAAALRRRHVAVQRIINLKRERDFILAFLETPEKPYVSVYRKFRPVDHAEIKLQDGNRTVERSNVTIESEGVYTTGLVLTDSGLILCLNYDLAKRKPTAGTIEFADGEQLAVVGRSTDPIRGFVVFTVKDTYDPLFERLTAAVLKSPERIFHSRTADIRFNLGDAGALKVGAQIERKSDELPGSRSHQSFTMITTSKVVIDGGVAYTTEGWMTGPAQDRGTGEAFALAARGAEDDKWNFFGINEAYDTVAAYYAEAIVEIESADRPELITP